MRLTNDLFGSHFTRLTSTVADDCSTGIDAREGFDIGTLRKGSTQQSLHGIVRNHLQRPSSETNEAVEAQWEETQKLDPNQLLAIVRQELVDQELGANSDYLGFLQVTLTITTYIYDITADPGSSLAPARGLASGMSFARGV